MVVLRRFFATDLVGQGEIDIGTPPRIPGFAATVVALTLVGFFVASVLHVDPAFAALGGAVTLAVPALVHRRAKVRDIGLALDVPFLAFVLALGLVVKAVSLHGLGSLVVHLVPNGTSLGSLLLVAGIAAMLANVINNLPAVLLLLPAAAAAGPGWYSRCSSASTPAPTSPTSARLRPCSGGACCASAERNCPLRSSSA